MIPDPGRASKAVDLLIDFDVEHFEFQNQPVRFVMIDGEPHPVLADLCAVLDIANVGNVAARIDQAAIRHADIRSGGQRRKVTTVTEAGMYEVVFRSDKPEAIDFRRWVTGDVLPQIRRTGSYRSPALSGPQLVAAALVEANKMLEAKDERIAELEPKADLADNYLTAQGGARLVSQVAKTYGLKQIELRHFLLEDGLIFTRHAQCGEIQYDHYAQYAHHFLPRETVVQHQFGSCSHYTLYVLPRGVELIGKHLRTKGLIG